MNHEQIKRDRWIRANQVKVVLDQLSAVLVERDVNIRNEASENFTMMLLTDYRCVISFNRKVGSLKISKVIVAVVGVNSFHCKLYSAEHTVSRNAFR